MAKRFTETTKWADPWFRSLAPTLKHGWNYLCDNCDAAGVIELDAELANFQIGERVDWDALVDASGDRIERLPNGRLHLTKFIDFQYGTLSDTCPPHKPAIKCLKKHGLSKVLERYQIPFDKVLDKNKDKDKEKDKGGAGGKFDKPTLPQVAAYCAERGGKVDPSLWFDHYESNGWKVGKNPMRDWRAAVRKWEHGGFENRAGPPQKPPGVRQVTLVVFNAHAAGHDFKDGPYKKEIGEHKKVWGTLKNGRKIESYTDPTWQPKN